MAACAVLSAIKAECPATLLSFSLPSSSSSISHTLPHSDKSPELLNMKSTPLVAATALLAGVVTASPINLSGRQAQDYPDTTAAYSSATITPEYYPSTRPTGSWYHPTTTYTNTVGPRPSVAPGTPSVGILCNATATDMSITPNLTLPVGERPVYVVLGRGK